MQKHRRVCRLLQIALLTALGASAGVAQAPKPPWEWTADERLAARFDPGQIHARREEALARQDEGGPVPAPGFAVIHGGRNPELLFAWELFQHLASRGFHSFEPIRESFRASVAERAPAGVLAADFWTRLEKASEVFVDALATQRAIIDDLSRSAEDANAPLLGDLEAAREGYCRKRYRALERARQEFGREWFDRFLYEAVAPDVGMIWPEKESWPEVLRQAEGGCE